jgi:hypothetical protein
MERTLPMRTRIPGLIAVLLGLTVAAAAAVTVR